MTDFRKTSIDELRPSVSDDRDGCLFTATVHRKPVADLKLANETLDIPQKTSGKRRENVGKDFGCLSRKQPDYHP